MGSKKRDLIKKYVSDFNFSEYMTPKLYVKLKGVKFSVGKSSGKFAKFKFENQKEEKDSISFRCMYKMMRRFKYSLN